LGQFFIGLTQMFYFCF